MSWHGSTYLQSQNSGGWQRKDNHDFKDTLSYVTSLSHSELYETLCQKGKKRKRNKGKKKEKRKRMKRRKKGRKG